MPHNAVSAASALLQKAHDKGLSLTPMQLLKLVYIAHGWMLGLYSRPLISDNVEAWRYGPVVPSVYQAIKTFRNSPVSEIRTAAPAQLDECEADVVDQVLSIYGNKTGIKLSAITHQAGTPWDKTWSSSGKNAVISNDVIESHYAELYEQAQKSEPA